MRLILVTHNVDRNDGQARVNYEIALHALNRGAKVTLVSASVAPDLVNRGAAWIPVRPIMQRPALFKVLEMTLRANRRCSRGVDPAVVVANGFTLTLAHDVNILHFVHGAARQPLRLANSSSGPLRSVYERLYGNVNAVAEKRALGAASTIVAVSEKVKQEALSAFAPRRSPIVIHNGVDVDEFRPGGADRRALGLPIGVPLAIFVGGIRNRLKNLDIVLETLPDVPELHLAVAGETSRSLYPKLVHERGLEKRVHFLGFRADVAEIMRAVDVYVTMAFYESFSLALLEAMASGLPVISSQTVGASELLRTGAGIVLERPDDAPGLARAFRTVLGNPASARQMGASARIIAEEHTWNVMADKYLELFERVQASSLS